MCKFGHLTVVALDCCCKKVEMVQYMLSLLVSLACRVIPMLELEDCSDTMNKHVVTFLNFHNIFVFYLFALQCHLLRRPIKAYILRMVHQALFKKKEGMIL